MSAVPPSPPGKGWFRVENSDAGVGGPGWMRCTSQGNDYRPDAGRRPGLAWADFDGYQVTCFRSSLTNPLPSRIDAKVSGSRRWRRVAPVQRPPADPPWPRFRLWGRNQ